jgi:hypothetical protein
METKEIEKEMMNAIMYADMDEEEFWKTSTITPNEARQLDRAWSLIFSLRKKSERIQENFAKAPNKEGEGK